MTSPTVPEDGRTSGPSSHPFRLLPERVVPPLDGLRRVSETPVATSSPTSCRPAEVRGETRDTGRRKDSSHCRGGFPGGHPVHRWTHCDYRTTLLSPGA